MPVADLLSRLTKVKPTGKGRWQACCPAHDDRSPSLVVTEAEDGRVLIHCFAECSVAEIVASVGLELSDLFPARSPDHAGRVRRAFSADDVLRAMAREALIASVAASRLAHGTELSPADRDRLLVASARLQNAVDLVR